LPTVPALRGVLFLAISVIVISQRATLAFPPVRLG
jgi:hypothetical protein